MKYWRPAYYGLMAFWLLAGLGSGQRAFFVLFFSQALLALAALAMNVWASYTFLFQQTLSSSQTVHGQPVHLMLHIYNENILPYPLMKIRIATPIRNEHRDLQFNLAAGSQVDFDLVLDCPYRGDYRVGMTIIDFIDIFNLVRLPFNMARLPYYRMPELLVYPRLEHLHRIRMHLLERSASFRHHEATDDATEPFSTVRSYRPGDTRKMIHWKASCRQQTLLTRQFEQSAEPSVRLVIDFQAPPWTGEAAWQAEDALCESAAALIHQVLLLGLPLRLTCLGSPGPFTSDNLLGSRGLKDFQQIYRFLAAVQFSRPSVNKPADNKPADNKQKEFKTAGNQPTGPDQQASLLTSLLADLAAETTESRAILVLTTQVDLALVPALNQLRRHKRPAMIVVAGPSPDLATVSDLHLQLARQAAELQRQMNELQLPAWFVRYGEGLDAEMLRQQSVGSEAAPVNRGRS